MSGEVNIQDFMAHLEANNLVIAPRVLVEENLKQRKVEQLRRKMLQKPMLTFKEIADAHLFGDITTKAVKNFALKYAKKNELVKVQSGKIEKYKLVRPAVVRMAKQKGEWIED